MAGSAGPDKPPPWRSKGEQVRPGRKEEKRGGMPTPCFSFRVWIKPLSHCALPEMEDVKDKGAGTEGPAPHGKRCGRGEKGKPHRD